MEGKFKMMRGEKGHFFVGDGGEEVG